MTNKIPGMHTVTLRTRSLWWISHHRHWQKNKKKTDQYLLRSWAENELQTFGEYEKGGPIDVTKDYPSFL